MATTNQLLPVMRSDLIVRLLTRLLVGEVEENQRELAAALGVSEPSLSAATRAVCATGVIEVVRRGRAKYLRANTGSPLYGPMRALIAVATGPAVIIGRALAHTTGVDRAYIFGSWAARDAGEPGGPPRDIDVVVIVTDGAPTGPARAAVVEAERALGREVNPIFYTVARWEDPNNAFARNLEKGPMATLDLDPNQPRLPGTESLQEPAEPIDDWYNRLLNP